MYQFKYENDRIYLDGKEVQGCKEFEYSRSAESGVGILKLTLFVYPERTGKDDAERRVANVILDRLRKAHVINEAPETTD